MAHPTINGVNGVNGPPQTNGTTHNIVKDGYSKSPSKLPNSYAAKFNLADHFIGGNHLAAASPGQVKDFVEQSDGHTVITNVSKPPVL